jgi:hypothetical protein
VRLEFVVGYNESLIDWLSANVDKGALSVRLEADDCIFYRDTHVLELAQDRSEPYSIWVLHIILNVYVLEQLLVLLLQPILIDLLYSVENKDVDLNKNFANT